MIEKAISLIQRELNNYLKLKTGSISTSIVNLSGVIKYDGSMEADFEDSLMMTLINVEEEKTNRTQKPLLKEYNGSLKKINPEIRLNFFVLLSANFKPKNYDQALMFLSYAIGFFQTKNVFNKDNTPDIDSEIEKLIVELYTLNFEQLNHIWGFLGAKYMPSVLYKFRLVSIQEGVVIEIIDSISELNTSM